MVGLTRETTSVELNRLKKKGVISYKDQYYSVSTSKLLAMLGSDDFMNFNY
jgi:CRP-like cAMP-binding protein